MGINQLDDSLKRILKAELKDWKVWFEHPRRMNLALTKLAFQIKKVDFFKSDYGITIFFDFLEEFVKLKPSKPEVLIALNRVLQQIQERVNVRPSLNTNQMDTVIAYFKLLKTMRAQGLFTKKEITFSASDLTKLVLVTTQSSPFPKDRFDIYAFLRLSFDIPRFLNNYSELTQSIFLLASAEKVFSSNSIFNAFGSFHTLGYLGRLLHYYHAKPEFNYELPAALEEMKRNGKDLYNFYKPLIEEGLIEKGLLDFIFFKKFVSELARDISDTNPVQLCASDYSNYCNPDYKYFNSKFTCPEGSLPYFDIQIAHNHLTGQELISTCNALRNAENEFFPWLKTIAWKPQNTRSSLLLSISPNQSDFRDTTKLLEDYEPSDAVGGVYFSKGIQNTYFQGTAYSAYIDSAISVHEYMHQLFTMAIKTRMTWSYKMLTEGVPEVFAGGVCHPWHVSNLKEYVNDTEILESLRERKFSGYFDAYKWSAFLINKKPRLIKQLLTFYQEDSQSKFYSVLDQFLDDPVQRKGFLEWAQLQNQVCNDYNKQYLDSEKSSLYLADVSKQLATTTDSSITKKTTASIKIFPDENFSNNVTSDPNRLAYQIALVISSRDTDKAQKIESLLIKGANAKWQDSRTGNTLLHFLFYYNVYSDEIAHSLLQYGADVNICNHNLVTAYQVGLRKQVELEVRQRDLEGRPDALADNLSAIQAIKSIMRLFQQSPSFPKNLPSSITVMSTSTVPVSFSMSNSLPIFTEKLLSPSSPKFITAGKNPLLSSQMSNSLFFSTKKTSLPSSSSSPSSTEIFVYEKPPYEFHITINVSLSVAKGILSAINRVGFEKFIQNHEPFLRRHPYLFLLTRNIVEATTLSAMNLICFPSTKGILANYTELESAGLYFAMDMATSFGFGLVNAKILPLFNARKEDSWMKYLVKNLGSTGLWTLFFLLSNASIILGEKFQDHKTEVLLSGILNALLVAIIHLFAYQGVNYVDNCLHARQPKLPKKAMYRIHYAKDNVEGNEGNTQQQLLPNMGGGSVSQQAFFSKKTKSSENEKFKVHYDENHVEGNEGNTQRQLLLRQYESLKPTASGITDHMTGESSFRTAI